MKERASPKLGDYRRKRKAEVTNEPFGGDVPDAADGTLTGAFVVHLHDATRRHYDLRLEVGGVLASFAVPRGPSLDPEVKALAVKTEDHPIEYLDFEDVIPAKQYGAGAMIAWDRGTVEYLEGPAEAEIASGKVHLALRGMKLHGRYALVKLTKSAKGDEWLLFKKDDEHASTVRDLLVELPRSVLSGLTIEELARAAEVGEALVLRAFAQGATKLSPPVARALTAPSRSPLIEPSPRRLPARSGPSGSRRKASSAWVYDAALAGVRVLATREGDVATLHRF